MKLESLLDTLFVQGVELWLDNGHLRYRGPKAALTPAVLTNLKQHKNEIIAYLSQPELHPLSYGQQALWFEYQMAPDRPVYNLSLALRFRAAVNVTVLQTIFQQLVNRHATLRTTFTLDDGLPQQKIHQHQKVVIEQIDARPWSWAQLTEAVATAHKDPFDLVQGPLLRLHLFTHALEDHVFLLTTHHIVTDGLSIRLLLDELQTLHPVVQAETTLNLPPLPATYVDYVKWQSHLLQTEGDPLWRYWRQKLAGELPVLNLQTDYPRPPVWSYKGASQDVEIPADLTAALRHLARTEQTTLYTILLAAFQILLYRYTGQEDILVGTPTAGRSRPEFARLVGYFASPVVMRADLSGNPSFRTFLQQVRQTVAEALDHQDYPFPLLVEKLYQSRDPSRPPLCQAGFDFERSAPVNRPAGLPTPANGATKAARDEAAIVPFKVEQNEGVYELDLGLFETPEQLSGALKYNPDLFTPGTIQHIVGCYLTLLRGVVADPDQNIVDLPLLTKTERHQILAKWNDTQVSHASAKAVHYLFEDQVERTPDAVAIVFGDQHLTYCELNQRANQLAYTLHFHDIDGHFVGIYVERSLEMIIGLLGILKAGAAYLPLDPTYPPERLAFMISDADLSLIVSHSSLADQVQQVTSQTQQNIIWLDTLFNRLPAQPISNPLSRITPNHLAYVIYTSGSTGQPKGVMIPHRGLTNFLYSMQQQPGLQTSDILLSVTTLSFDIAALELFLPLMVGAKAILVNQSIVADGEALTDLIAASETNVMQATPATWRLLLEADWTGASHFKALCGGEALSLNLAQRLLAKVGQLWNLYGPTETTIWSSM